MNKEIVNLPEQKKSLPTIRPDLLKRLTSKAELLENIPSEKRIVAPPNDV